MHNAGCEVDRGKWPKISAAIEQWMVRHRTKLIYVHIAMFFFFITLLTLPLFLPEPAEHAGVTEHFTRFARFAIWTIWFPLVFLSVIFSGRSWCGILCPMGAASEWTNKIGFKKPIPAWVRHEATPIVSFIIVTIWGQLIGVRDHPEGAAWVFGIVLLAALLLGLFYGANKRAWCRHMCPIGLLLGVFSRIGAVQFAPKRPLEGGDRYTEKTACPTMISLRHKTESRHCIECFKCVSPQAKGGLYLKLRTPGEEIVRIKEHHPSLAEIIFLFLGTGVSLGGFLWLVLPSYQTIRLNVGQWFIERDWLHLLQPGPSWLVSVHPERREVFLWLDFITITGYMLAWMIGITVFLTLTTWASSALAKRYGSNTADNERFIEIAYHYTPVAMLSLLLGLGSDLLVAIEKLVGAAGLTGAKIVLLTGSIIWSIALAKKILERQEVKAWLIPAFPGIIGSLGIALCWGLAIV